MTFPLKSSAHNKLSNDVDELLKKSELSRTNELKMKEGTIRRPTFGDTNTVILSNSMDGNKLIKKIFYRLVRYKTICPTNLLNISDSII